MLFRRITLVSTLLLLVTVAAPASAQKQRASSQETNDEIRDIYIDQYAIDNTDIMKELKSGKSDPYITPTPENLSKMYWAIGKFDVMEDKLIDLFMRINECDLYTKYYHNDFEWSKIRVAAREAIKQEKANYPTRFEILTEISLGRYDQDKEEFTVAEESKIEALRRLDYGGQDQKEYCNIRGRIHEYPPGLVIILSEPFTLTTVPVKRELARLYLEEAKSFYESFSEKRQMRQYERTAFLRLKIRISQYKETGIVGNGNVRAFVFGVIDGYEIYADPERTKPLYFQDLTKQRFSRLRRINRDKQDESGNTAGTNEGN